MPSGRRDSALTGRGNSALLAEGPPPAEAIPPDGWYAMVGAALGHIQEHQAAQTGPRPRIPWRSCHPVTFLGAIQLSGGAGTLNQPDMYGPKDPYWWDLRTIDLWGFTAGTVTVNLNSLNGPQIAQASQPGEFTWGAQHLLSPRDILIFSATGISGNVQIAGQAVEIETPWLPDYLV